MQLSSDTVAVLKNFADINQNILVKQGNTLTTISTMKNILAEAEISDSIPQEFAIYDLPEFLRSIDLFQKPSLNFEGESHVNIAEEILNNQLSISLQINQSLLHQQKQ